LLDHRLRPDLRFWSDLRFWFNLRRLIGGGDRRWQLTERLKTRDVSLFRFAFFDLSQGPQAESRVRIWYVIWYVIWFGDRLKISIRAS
jgi:hypothetical protein